MPLRVVLRFASEAASFRFSLILVSLIRSCRKCAAKFHSRSETKHRHSPLIPPDRTKSCVLRSKTREYFLKQGVVKDRSTDHTQKKNLRGEKNFETALPRRSEMLENRHRLMTDHAGLSRRTGHRRNQSIRETMVAPGNHIKACGGPVVKRQLAGTDFLPTGHRSRLT